MCIKRLYCVCLYFILLSTCLWGQTYPRGVYTDSRDGQTYSTVTIGDQVWLAQNLNYVTENGSWPVPGESTGKPYGRFYTWEAAKEAVPEGWHLPSKKEFETLAATLGITDLPNRDDLYPLLIEGGVSGFDAQLTGSHEGVYGKPGQTASFWSSDRWWFTRLIPISKNPWRLSVRAPNYINIGHFATSDCGFTVRCVKDK